MNAKKRDRSKLTAERRTTRAKHSGPLSDSACARAAALLANGEGIDTVAQIMRVPARKIADAQRAGRVPIFHQKRAQTPWTAREEARLQALVRDGLSRSQIAETLSAEFGTKRTPNAIAGRMNRLGLCTPIEVFKKRRAEENAQREKLSAARKNRKSVNPLGKNARKNAVMTAAPGDRRKTANRLYGANFSKAPFDQAEGFVDATLRPLSAEEERLGGPPICDDPQGVEGCRFVDGEVTGTGEGWSYCRRKRAAGSSYCAGHRRRCVSDSGAARAYALASTAPAREAAAYILETFGIVVSPGVIGMWRAWATRRSGDERRAAA